MYKRQDISSDAQLAVSGNAEYERKRVENGTQINLVRDLAKYINLSLIHIWSHSNARIIAISAMIRHVLTASRAMELLISLSLASPERKNRSAKRA